MLFRIKVPLKSSLEQLNHPGLTEKNRREKVQSSNTGAPLVAFPCFPTDNKGNLSEIPVPIKSTSDEPKGGYQAAAVRVREEAMPEGRKKNILELTQALIEKVGEVTLEERKVMDDSVNEMFIDLPNLDEAINIGLCANRDIKRLLIDRAEKYYRSRRKDLDIILDILTVAKNQLEDKASILHKKLIEKALAFEEQGCPRHFASMLSMKGNISDSQKFDEIVRIAEYVEQGEMCKYDLMYTDIEFPELNVQLREVIQQEQKKLNDQSAIVVKSRDARAEIAALIEAFHKLSPAERKPFVIQEENTMLYTGKLLALTSQAHRPEEGDQGAASDFSAARDIALALNSTTKNKLKIIDDTLETIATDPKAMIAAWRELRAQVLEAHNKGQNHPLSGRISLDPNISDADILEQYKSLADIAKARLKEDNVRNQIQKAQAEYLLERLRPNEAPSPSPRNKRPKKSNVTVRDTVALPLPQDTATTVSPAIQEAKPIERIREKINQFIERDPYEDTKSPTKKPSSQNTWEEFVAVQAAIPAEESRSVSPELLEAINSQKAALEAALSMHDTDANNHLRPRNPGSIETVSAMSGVEHSQAHKENNEDAFLQAVIAKLEEDGGVLTPQEKAILKLLVSQVQGDIPNLMLSNPSLAASNRELIDIVVHSYLTGKNYIGTISEFLNVSDDLEEASRKHAKLIMYLSELKEKGYNQFADMLSSGDIPNSQKLKELQNMQKYLQTTEPLKANVIEQQAIAGTSQEMTPRTAESNELYAELRKAVIARRLAQRGPLTPEEAEEIERNLKKMQELTLLERYAPGDRVFAAAQAAQPTVVKTFAKLTEDTNLEYAYAVTEQRLILINDLLKGTRQELILQWDLIREQIVEAQRQDREHTLAGELSIKENITDAQKYTEMQNMLIRLKTQVENEKRTIRADLVEKNMSAYQKEAADILQRTTGTPNPMSLLDSQLAQVNVRVKIAEFRRQAAQEEVKIAEKEYAKLLAEERLQRHRGKITEGTGTPPAVQFSSGELREKLNKPSSSKKPNSTPGAKIRKR